MNSLLRISFIGCHKPGDSTNLFDVDDGTSHHHGPVAAGRGQHGGEGDQGHHVPQELQTHNSRVRLPQSCRYVDQRW